MVLEAYACPPDGQPIPSLDELIFVRTTAWGLLGGLATAFAMGAVISLFMGGGTASQAMDLAFYTCILAASGGVAFGVSRRRGESPRAAWIAGALGIGTMILLAVAAYISYFEFVLDGGFSDFE